MEMALNMGAFEELDQKEMCVVDGGAGLDTVGNALISAGTNMSGNPVTFLPAVLVAELGVLCKILYQRYTLIHKS